MAAKKVTKFESRDKILLAVDSTESTGNILLLYLLRFFLL